MQQFDQAVARSQESIISTNKVLKNTYMLLSATLAFSAVMAMVSLFLAVPVWTYYVSLIGGMVLGMFVLPRTANSAKGIGVIFLVTGMLGFGLGAILQLYMMVPKGPQVIATAFGGTAAIFLGLSGYALVSRKNFSFMGGFLMAGMMTVLTISAGVILLMSGFILFDPSRIIHGGETNYIMATYGLYLSIFNIFIHLLNLLMAFAGGND